MRLAVPVSAASEVEALCEAGATELYCGIQDARWKEAFGDHDSISRRQGAANLGDMRELKALVERAGAHSLPVMLTLNAGYSEAQLPLALETALAFEQLGGTGVMVTDLALLDGLKRKGSRLVRALSLLAEATNTASLSVYRELGVTRAVFPRQLSAVQMGELLSAHGGLEGEALIWLDKCRFMDGHCRFLHSVGYQAAPDGAEPAGELFSYDTDYRLPACWELCGEPPSRTPACAVCAAGALSDAGIAVFKMGGRGRSLPARLQGIRFWIECLALANPAQKRAAYRDRFGAACTAETCYAYSPECRPAGAGA